MRRPLVSAPDLRIASGAALLVCASLLVGTVVAQPPPPPTPGQDTAVSPELKLADETDLSSDELRYNKRYSQAAQHFGNADHGRAEALTWLLITDDPERFEGWLLLGRLDLLDKATYGDARRMFEKAHALDPESPDPLRLLAILDLNEKKPKEATDHLAAAARLDRDDFELQYEAGKLSRVGNRLGEAREFFTNAVELKPDNNNAVLSLGDVLVRLGQYSEAVKVYRAGLTLKFNGSIAISLNHALLSAAKYDEALDSISAFEVLPEVKSQPTFLFTMQIQRARAHLGKVEPAKAEAALRAALRDHPNISEEAYALRARYLLGISLSMQGCTMKQARSCGGATPLECCARAQEAVGHFEDVLANPASSGSQPDAGIRKGLNELGAGQPEIARETLAKDIGVRLGLAQFEVGELIKAEGTIHKVIKSNRSASLGEAFGAFAVTLLAFADRTGDDRDLQGAIRFYREAVARAPDFADIKNLRIRRQWPPHAIDAIARLKSLSDKQLAADSEDKDAGNCTCQPFTGQGHTPSPLIALLFLCALALWARVRARHA